MYQTEGATYNNMLFNQHQKRKLESSNGLKGKTEKKCQKKILLSWELMQMDSYQ